MQIMLNMWLLLLSTFLLSLHNYDVNFPNFTLNDLQNKKEVSFFLFWSYVQSVRIHFKKNLPIYDKLFKVIEFKSQCSFCVNLILLVSSFAHCGPREQLQVCFSFNNKLAKKTQFTKNPWLYTSL